MESIIRELAAAAAMGKLFVQQKGECLRVVLKPGYNAEWFHDAEKWVGEAAMKVWDTFIAAEGFPYGQQSDVEVYRGEQRIGAIDGTVHFVDGWSTRVFGLTNEAQRTLAVLAMDMEP